MDSEKRWIRKIKRNASDAAANELVSKYYKEMYAFVYKQTLDSELSLDLTQEIFIRVLKSIHNYDSKKATFRTWLYKLASNRLIDFYRSKSYKDVQRVEPIEDYEFEDEYDMTISLEYKEDFEKVTTLVNDLDAGSQRIIRLKLFGEYTFQEIASIEMIPQSTVKTKYYAALKQIRKGMEVHHG
ncbi:RNA polymerase sigma factor [Aneurinibacillus aneurinilyticus]|jgi:RNA polymerase sigma-70 factor (ECF subfamily)|uniref:Sigma-70 region 2 n=1 Tax=Aneurinibacillus aneurinilyticus ATCC 12856 TaxID=649747 RepID=U1WFV3_ANEAE|nr:sigma-70 family RNA polymerase sigma factor [Aneurinibacillus aneurinilyticus]ERI07434.1 Sigma-70 region 2 [Aneurinibacillus aneurinilyticus ATCC 12856]MED0708994.1 sigma-70 family RNA polymerase sigma factor [Aneurinibacillus aneurinilyticus]MED0723048.1 sigma-70 family RNA polymerase sigma factor [Aneurinibacillus aneurinilyticus]MED0739914.1 sigma-70 family RNA polymerase sigma factor [Aneurinibacillus aneurinilyticus]